MSIGVGMALEEESVVVAHPAKQHSYQVARAIQSAGLLLRFLTPTYFKPNAMPYRLVRWAPKAARERVLRELRKRRLDGLDEHRITDLPVVDAVARTVDRLQEAWHERGGVSYYPVSHRLFGGYVRRWLVARRPRPSVLYGFQGIGAKTLGFAKRLGITTVLDLPILLDGPRIIAEESAKLGLAAGGRMDAWRQDEVLAADCIITPSEAVARSVEVVGIPRNRIIVLPFGVDITGFAATKEKQVRTDRKFRALFVGKFDMRKGVHYLLEAWKQLSLPDAELTIVGPPVSLQFAKSMRLKYKGYFIELGNIPHYEINRVFANADIFVFPSLCEGSALVTYEALASGLPCVVTSEAGSVVRDGVEGFVVPARDVGAIGEGVSKLYDNPSLRARMGEAARARATSYTWERYQSNLVKGITEFVGSDRCWSSSAAFHNNIEHMARTESLL